MCAKDIIKNSLPAKDKKESFVKCFQALAFFIQLFLTAVGKYYQNRLHFEIIYHFCNVGDGRFSDLSEMSLYPKMGKACHVFVPPKYRFWHYLLHLSVLFLNKHLFGSKGKSLTFRYVDTLRQNYIFCPKREFACPNHQLNFVAKSL